MGEPFASHLPAQSVGNLRLHWAVFLVEWFCSHVAPTRW